MHIPNWKESSGPGGLKPLKLRETFYKTALKTKDVHEVAKIVMVSLDSHPPNPPTLLLEEGD